MNQITWVKGGAGEQLLLGPGAPVLDDPQVGEGVAPLHREGLVQPEGDRLIPVVWNAGLNRLKNPIKTYF